MDVDTHNFRIDGERANDLAGDFVLIKADCFANDAHREHGSDARDGMLDAHRILLREAVAQNKAP